MKWEFLGVQDLPETPARGKGHTYKVSLWRSPVPGGWMIMSINNRSSDPQPLMTFYPDADHVWVGNAPAEANYLLRPASAGAIGSAPDQLLRASDADDSEPKLLES